VGQVFMNIVLDEAIEEKPDGEKVRIGMVVCLDETNLTESLFFFVPRK
jgi:small nuclear ribonucleoprotein (snRNP)-like protein